MQLFKKNHRSGTTAFKILNDEMGDILKKVKSFEESGLLIKSVSETIKMKQKNNKVDFLSCF